MAALASLFGASPLIASQAGFVAGGVFSYALNRGFTFRSGTSHRRAAPRYLAASALGWAVNGCALAMFRAVFGGVWLAQLAATAVVAVASFVLQRYFVFAA